MNTNNTSLSSVPTYEINKGPKYFGTVSLNTSWDFKFLSEKY